MTATAQSWEGLQIDQEVGAYDLDSGSAHATDYAEVVDPDGRRYGDTAVAPLFVNSLRPVKSLVGLPDGTLHAREAVEFLAVPQPGRPMSATLTIGDKYVRRGRRYLVVRYVVSAEGEPLMVANKTFVWPGQIKLPDTSPKGDTEWGLVAASTTPAVRQFVPLVAAPPQSLLDDFGRVGGGDGPTHTDPAFAEPLFGGTILQGMYLYELVAQAMIGLSDVKTWCTGGRLASRFIGNIHAGEEVSLTGSVHDVHKDSEGARIARCSFTATKSDGTPVLVASAVGAWTNDDDLQEVLA